MCMSVCSCCNYLSSMFMSNYLSSLCLCVLVVIIYLLFMSVCSCCNYLSSMFMSVCSCCNYLSSLFMSVFLL